MEALTLIESRRLEACIEDYRDGVERGRCALEKCGKSLKVIRDDRLYRASHPTFEAFCEQELQARRQRAYQLIAHYETIENIKGIDQLFPAECQPRLTLKNVNHGSQMTERATREIADLPPAQQREVVKKVAESGKKPTAKAVKEARQEVAPKPEKPKVLPIGQHQELPADGKPTGMMRANAIMAIRSACKEADTWTDEECRGEVRDELRKWLKRFDPLPAADKHSGRLEAAHNAIAALIEVASVSELDEAREKLAQQFPALFAACKKEKPARFVPPTVEEVEAYCDQHNISHFDARKFIGHYGSKGWKKGQTPINTVEKWQGAVLGSLEWCTKATGKTTGAIATPPGKYDHIDNAV